MKNISLLLLKIRRSKGAFHVHRWEEEEELYSIHVRQCFLVWIALTLTIEMIRQAVFPQISGLYEPFLLFGFVVLYHIAHIIKGKVIWIARGIFLAAPVVPLVLRDYRLQFMALLHQVEMALADAGIRLFHISEYGEIGFWTDMIFALILLWGTLFIYEISKRWEGLLLLVPVFISLVLILIPGWSPAWWIYPALVFELLLAIMPSFIAWAFLLVPVGAVVVTVVLIKGAAVPEKAACYDSWQEWRYGKVSMLPDGNLSNNYKTRRTTDTALKIKSESGGPYYLRGFVGTTFDGKTSWEPDREAVRALEPGIMEESYDIPEVLHQRGYYSQNRMAGSDDEYTKDAVTFSVNNISASTKYLYMPYEMKTSPDLFVQDGLCVSAAGDTLLAAGLKGQKKYSYKVLENHADDVSTETADHLLKNGSESKFVVNKPKKGKKTATQYYESYVSRVFLSLPKEIRELISEEFEQMPVTKQMTTVNVVNNIRGWMNSNLTYTKQPAPIPEDRDFFSWFIKEKKGNDVYYASFAAMMFRYYGIPARYVEGYLYHPTGHSMIQEVTGEDAHAWVEIYIEEIGWLPVEVSPGYAQMMTAYLPEPEAVTEDQLSGNTREQEENQEQESREENSQDNPEETDPELSDEDAAKEDESSAEDEKQKEEFFLDILKKLGSVILLLLGISGILFAGYLLIGLLRYLIRERSWKKTVVSSQCIAQWYRHVLMCLFLLYKEKPAGIRFYEWDNRNRSFLRLLKMFDPDFDQDEIGQCLEIYRRVMFSGQPISWRERKRFVKAFRNERRILQKQLSLWQRFKLIYFKEFR